MDQVIRIVMVVLSLGGFALSSSSGESVVRAVRAGSAPVIDGKLTDNCWQTAVLVTNFLLLGSNNAAPHRTIGYVLFDDANIYVGMKCPEEDMSSIRTQARKHEDELFRDDVVEIMIDPGLTRTNHFQFAVNPSGSKFDCSYTGGGKVENPAWSGEWAAAALIGNDDWTAEVSIPYHTLGITSGTGARWGINLCREKHKTREYSSIAESGTFNETKNFRELAGIDVNFGEYCYRIGEPDIVWGIESDKLCAKLFVPIKNEAVAEKRVRLEKIIPDTEGKILSGSEEVTFKAGEEKNILLEPLEIQPDSKQQTGLYSIASPKTKAIKITDLDNKRVFATAAINIDDLYSVLGVKAGWQKETETIDLEAVINLSDEELRKCRLVLEITKAGDTEPVLRKEVQSPGKVAKFAFSGKKAPGGKLVSRAAILSQQGSVIAETKAIFVKSAAEAKRLNNLALELLNIKEKTRTGFFNNLLAKLLNLKGKTSPEYKEYNFENPREGWIFVTATADIKDKSRVSVSIDAAPEEASIIVHDKTGATTLEAMRRLSAGTHKLKVWSSGKASYAVVVRSIPELLFYSVRGNPPIGGYVPSDYWQFLQKHVFSNVNYLVSGSANFINDSKYMAYIEAWKKQGKKWLHVCHNPGAGDNQTVTADEAYAFWAGQAGLQHPLLDGVLVDEFLGRFPRQKYDVWRKAVNMISGDERFKEKDFYVFVGGSAYRSGLKVRRLLDTVIGADYKVAWEIYLPDMHPAEHAADQYLQKQLDEEVLDWKEKNPGIVEHLIVVPAYGEFPRFNFDVNPSVDFKVFMDMQLNHLANARGFSNVYGVMWYCSSSASEETVRWASRLFRHYAIEGKTGMLSKEYGFKYTLDHVLNPDFDRGADGWQIKPAEEGSATVKNLEGFGAISRFRREPKQGDALLWMKRSGKSPNIIRQEIKNLEPGKMYSLKMFTADYNDLIAGKSEKKEHIISIEIENAELAPDKCFQSTMESDIGRGGLKGFDKQGFWFNGHWKVFRAKSTSATLCISDWKSDKEPGAPIGQELAVNFVEVQPYFEE